MTEQWQELKETIKELRYSNGDLTQQEVCSFLGVYMETLEKQMQESTYAKGTIIKSALKYLVKRQIEEGSVGFAVDNDHDHDCCWDDVLAWIEAQPCSEDLKEAYLKGYDYGVKDWFKSKTQPCEDCISREAVIKNIKQWFDKIELNPDILIDSIITLPPVYPERPKGKWIGVRSYEAFGGDYEAWMAHGNPIAYHYCSNCKEEAYLDEDGEEILSDFCPFCGAYMRESEEEK